MYAIYSVATHAKTDETGAQNSNAGKLSFTWFGPTPRVMIPDPALVREVLSNKFGHFPKPKSSRVANLIANGIVSHEGEKWAKHRRILNPAFHHDKLKVLVQLTFHTYMDMDGISDS